MQVCELYQFPIEVRPSFHLKTWRIWKLLKGVINVRANVEDSAIARDREHILVIVVVCIIIIKAEFIAFGVRITPGI